MNPTNSKKVMKISINGDISYFDYHLDGRKNTFFNVPYGGYSLTAGDYIGLKLAIYQPFKPIRGQENKYGSKIASYLKDPYYVLPYPTYGDVVLIDDAGDMNQGKLDKINSIIELKDKKVIPAELKDILIIDQTKLTSESEEAYRKLAQADKEGKKHYGELKGKFPDWLLL